MSAAFSAANIPSRQSSLTPCPSSLCRAIIAADDTRSKAMTDGFALYGSPHSLFTYKVALMLRLSGAPFSFRYVSFQKGMHRTPEFLAMSRWGQVPVLRHEGKTLVQSATILEYLAGTLGKFGGDSEEIREWLCWEADRLTPPAFNAYGVRLGELKLLALSWRPE